MTPATATSPTDTELLVGGRWVAAASGATFEDVNPATGETLAEVAAAGPEDIDRAVAAAADAFHRTGWARARGSERGEALYRIAQLMRASLDELAALEARDVGKLPADARAEVELCASLFEYYAGAANKVLGETYPAGPDTLCYTRREPLGVVAAIVPWNYPLPLATLKVAPALAMGNAVVLKPAEQAPLTALRLGALALEAGLPEGLLNVVPGLGEVTGQALIDHRDVAMIAFTGSTEVGHKVMHAAANRIARVELELGGKSPHLIFPDADLDAVTDNVALGLFKNCGQDCCAGSRILVHRDVHAEVLERLKASAEAQRPGDPFVADTTIGPLISQSQRARVHRYVEGARKTGGDVVTGGRELTDGFPQRSSFYAPTLVSGAGPGTAIFDQEVFGPVGVVVPFAGEDEAVELANASTYGLAAAIWTNDLSLAHRTAAAVEAGMVWINEYYAHVMEAPFGGYKQSGIGKDYSMHALDAYGQIKEVTVRLGDGPRS